MSSFSLKHGSVTLYAQVANILRDRVYSGIWAEGEAIPTLDKLVEEFGVARVTVRQAVQMLSEEGLLSGSHRGRRTFVTWKAPKSSDLPIFSSTDFLEDASASYSVDIISYEEFDELPPRMLRKGEPKGPYVRIRKRDLYKGIPYVLSETYVRKEIYRQFPPGAETVSKIARLVRDVVKPKQITGEEIIRVGMSTEDECGKLLCNAGSPVARVSRTFLDQDGNVLLTGNYVYREKEFTVVRDISSYLS